MCALASKIFGTARIYARWGCKTLTRSLGRARVARFLRRHPGAIAVRFDSPGNGLFAHLTWSLQAVQWARRENRSLHLRCSSAQYSGGTPAQDWLSTILSQEIAASPPPELVVGEFEELPFFTDSLPTELPAVRALFRSQFSVSPAIGSALAAHLRELFAGRFPIGLHYRGTDKSLEAPRLPPALAIESARRALAEARRLGAEPTLFVASDEQAFIAQAEAELPSERVVCLRDSFRSTHGLPLHQSGISAGERLAREAMLDCLLLGHCRVLLKTSSMLSAWSLILGEEPSVVMLSRPFAGRVFFPDDLAARIAWPIGEEVAAVGAAFSKSSRL